MKNSYRYLIDTVSGKDCAVLGFGVSNQPLVRLLLSLGVCGKITVYDKLSVEELGENAEELLAAGVRFVKGFEQIDAQVIFRTPGIRPDIEGISECLESGAVLTSEMESFIECTPAATFGITGSDGKTTTTTLTGMILDAAGEGRTFVGGNIGTPLLDKCGEMSDKDHAVLELSSFQLMTFKSAPKYSAITNLSPNHMDWHKGGMNEYLLSKKNIVGENTDRVVLNAECSYTLEFGRELIESTNKEIIFFSSRKKSYSDAFGGVREGVKLVFVRDGMIVISDGGEEKALLDTSLIRVPGMHNVENYMTAIALTYGLVPTEVYSRVASEFYGVEHRLELVRTLDGVDFYNSSIDSSPSRTVAALSALRGRDIVAICGGYDKNLSYDPLADALCDGVRAVVLTGATAPKIKKALEDCSRLQGSGLTVFEEDTFEDAVKRAASLGRAGGCVVLTPASASFDRFKNFAQRGRYFKELVKKL